MLAIRATMPTRAGRATRALCSMMFIAAAITAAACGGSDSTGPSTNSQGGGGGGGVVPPAAVASVSMSPAQASLAIAGTQQLMVTVRDASGAELTGRSMSFASSASTIASVSGSGFVTAVAAGQANITVTVEGKTAESSITVQPAAPAVVASVTLSPGTVTLDAGETANLSARVADAANNALTGRVVVWASETPGVATVDAGGKVTAVAAGTARISATSEGKKGEAVVQVRRVVATVQITGALDTLEAYDVRVLRAVARDAAGEIMPETQFAWTSSNGAVATTQNAVGTADATLTGVDRGTVTVTATSSNGKSATATRVVVIRYRSITAATMHSCDIASGGVAYCWGLNSTDARLGDSNVGDGKFHSEPFRVPGERGFTQLVTFARFTCGLKTDHKAYCWGSNSWGTLGDGTNKSFSATPVAVAGNNTFISLSAGTDHACGVTTTNALLCWGHNDWGQFGSGNTTTPSGPVVAANGMQFRAVTASSFATCGVTMTGTAYCWGGNGLGELGDGQRIAYGNVFKTAPSLVVGGLTFEALSGGNHFACGLTTSRQAYCWGSNGGKLGTGNTTDSSSPLAVSGGHSFVQISSGYGHSCGVTAADDVACWGDNGYGQLGTTSQALRVPYLIPNLKAAEVAASGIGTGAGSHSCAISKDRLTVRCWGRNEVGQLGNGSVTAVDAMNPTPSIVVGQKPL